MTSFLTLEPGTAVVDRFGASVGKVHRVLLLETGAHRIDGVPEARHDRTEVTEADRDEVIECLKRAYVRDELTTDQLGDRVSIAHLAESLSELDAALADVNLT